MKKRDLIFGFSAMIFLVLIISQINFLSAVESLYCAEKTTDGAWCQNVPIEKINKTFNYVPTSCASTSYCKLGTCIRPLEGVCTSNVPKRVCDESGGVWNLSAPSEISLCKLGCCLLGNQAAFTTQTNCGKLSADYNLNTTFRQDITDEAKCIASAYPTARGACVKDEGIQKTCVMTTNEDCAKRGASSAGSSVTFHQGLLCTAQSLGTSCLPSERTTCVQGKDEVYFLDSCGNTANVYDASKVRDNNYWERLISGEALCSLQYNQNGKPVNSNTCGNCDYYQGSVCRQSNSLDSIKPEMGNNICVPLSCEWNGQTYLHGESWCENTASSSLLNTPGSEYSRLLCYNGEVTIEPCASFRQEICEEKEVREGTGFTSAKCILNKWQDCALQIKKEDCENSEKRYCIWQASPQGVDLAGTTLLGLGNLTGEGVCLPKYPTGLKHWADDSLAKDACEVGSIAVTLKLQRSAWAALFNLDEWYCVGKNCELYRGEENSWSREANKLCSSLGDCGAQPNYLGELGSNEIKIINQSEIITKEW